jgi:hypothetical protein
VRATHITLALLITASLVADASAQSRIWKDIHGNSTAASWQRFTKDRRDPANDRVVLRVAGKTVGLKFWELMPEDQKFVKELLAKKGKDGDHLEITDAPRDWTSRAGQKGRGQFLKVEKDGTISVIVQGAKKSFKFEDFIVSDQDYLRALLAKDGKEDLVPKKPEGEETTSPSATGSRPAGTPVTGIPGLPNQPGIPGTTPPGIPRPGFGTQGPGGIRRPGFNQPGFPNQPGAPTGTGFPGGTAAPGGGIPGGTGIPGGNQPGFPANPGIGTNTGPGTTPTTPGSGVPGSGFPNTATSSIPDVPIPNHQPNMEQPAQSTFTPPTMNVPDVQLPQMEMQEVYECSNCKREVSESATSCPYCKTRFDYVENADGSRTDLPGGRAGGIGAAVFVIMALAGGAARFFRRG